MTERFPFYASLQVANLPILWPASLMMHSLASFSFLLPDWPVRLTDKALRVTARSAFFEFSSTNFCRSNEPIPVPLDSARLKFPVVTKPIRSISSGTSGCWGSPSWWGSNKDNASRCSLRYDGAFSSSDGSKDRDLRCCHA
jgi:hypothetical protein